VRIVKSLLFWISTVCLVIAILLIAVPKLFGVEFRAVLTGSMTPDIPVGALVVIVPTEAKNIKIGDDITFVTGSEKVVTHRVVRIDRAKNEFTTWGIANDPSAIDAPNKYENILGVVKIHIPFVGRIFGWIATLSGKIIMATAIIAIYMLTFIIGIWTKDRKEKAAVAAQGTPNSTSQENKNPFEESEGCKASSNNEFATQFTKERQNLDFESNISETAAVNESHETLLNNNDGTIPALKDISGDNLLADFLKCDETIIESLENDDLFKKMLED